VHLVRLAVLEQVRERERERRIRRARHRSRHRLDDFTIRSNECDRDRLIGVRTLERGIPTERQVEGTFGLDRVVLTAQREKRYGEDGQEHVGGPSHARLLLFWPRPAGQASRPVRPIGGFVRAAACNTCATNR
jgi:hypothetical protein